MIRKKKSKMIRRKKEIKKIIAKNFGGCVPNVGKDCIKQEYIFTHMGTHWIDCGICHNCIEKPCKYYKEWKIYIKEMI